MADWKPIETAPKDRPIRIRGKGYGNRMNTWHYATVQWGNYGDLREDTRLTFTGWISMDGRQMYRFAEDWKEVNE